ncbi:MAG: alpha-ketoglutarate-dependent dioxygenase AlkB [Actinomycetota bacterium]|nr:alpha-ketoglutarate-dependent dioxygenase AlkB [Actinomycetota bacterium]
MALQHDLAWQASLFDTGEISYDAALNGCRRRHLAEGAWVDHLPGWLQGADELFARLLAETPWGQHQRWIYERKVTEPRLTHRWYLDGDAGQERPPQALRGMAATLSRHYGVAFTQVGVNLYRDGSDSVAWHGDRVAREIDEATVALVSLGAPRPFKLRPKGGGRSLTYLPGPGDLLVMGGSCQRTWDHAVPKVAAAGPRISIQFRHVYPRAAVPGRHPVTS